MKRKPTVFHESGDIVEGEFCRKCKKGRVIYNGNYFCEFWGHDYEGKRYGGPCDWAMDQKDTKANRRIIANYAEQRERRAKP